MNFEEVMERVGAIVEKDIGQRPYDKDIAEALSMTRTQYSNAKKRGSVPLEKVANYCALKRVSLSWVLFEQSSAMLEENTDSIFKVRYLAKINSSAGGGALNDDTDESSYLSVDRNYINKLGVKNANNLEAINVLGDSMESTISDGSIVLLDRNQKELDRRGIFVMNTPYGVFIKRIGINPAGGVDLISDNKYYETQTLPFEDVTIIGKVVGALEKI